MDSSRGITSPCSSSSDGSDYRLVAHLVFSPHSFGNLRRTGFFQTSVPASRHIASESVGGFTACRMHPLKHPSMVRFDDAPEHPGPATGALDRTAICTRKMYIKGVKMCSKS